VEYDVRRREYIVVVRLSEDEIYRSVYDGPTQTLMDFNNKVRKALNEQFDMNFRMITHRLKREWSRLNR
jgi:uncharacterized SAM-dependent methyltransferase